MDRVPGCDQPRTEDRVHGCHRPAGSSWTSPGGAWGLRPLTTLAKLPKSTGITLPKKTEIPAAVVPVCELTYFCTLGNIHANSKGYLDIGKLARRSYKN